MTRDIVIAEISHNPVDPDTLPRLIGRVYESLAGIARNGVIDRDGSDGILRRIRGFGDDRNAMPQGMPARRPESGQAGSSVPLPAQAGGMPQHADLDGEAHDRPLLSATERGEMAARLAAALPPETLSAGSAMPAVTHAATAREEGREPAVSREQSIHPDYIYCLFDGVRRKMLKRHIKTRYGMSPEAYRQYWELSDDYPMTAPNYSNEKRDYAVSTGFGLTRSNARAASRRAATRAAG